MLLYDRLELLLFTLSMYISWHLTKVKCCIIVQHISPSRHEWTFGQGPHRVKNGRFGFPNSSFFFTLFPLNHGSLISRLQTGTGPVPVRRTHRYPNPAAVHGPYFVWARFAPGTASGIGFLVQYRIRCRVRVRAQGLGTGTKSVPSTSWRPVPHPVPKLVDPWFYSQHVKQQQFRDVQNV